jgi:hypothetical protein
MMQMATVFAELERSMIRSRVMAGLVRVRPERKKTLGRPPVGRRVEEAIRQQLGAGYGILKVAEIVAMRMGDCPAGEAANDGSVGQRSPMPIIRPSFRS